MSLAKSCINVGASALLMCLCACATQTPNHEPPADAVPVAAPEVAAPAVRRADPAKLRPGLVIEFSLLVAGKPEFDRQAKRVSDNGSIVLPLLGAVDVREQTPDELSASLATRYGRYFVDPQVIIEFARDGNGEGVSPWGYVTVLGRVKTPGRVGIPATRDLTVSGAIQKAGGFQTSARTESILVTRRGSNGEATTYTISLNAVGAGGKVDDDLPLQSEDVVFVPEARF